MVLTAEGITQQQAGEARIGTQLQVKLYCYNAQKNYINHSQKVIDINPN